MIEGPGVPRPVAGLPHPGDDHPVDVAHDPWGVALEIAADPAQIEGPPPPPALTPVIAGRRPTTAPADQPTTPSGPNRGDHRVSLLVNQPQPPTDQ